MTCELTKSLENVNPTTKRIKTAIHKNKQNMIFLCFISLFLANAFNTYTSVSVSCNSLLFRDAVIPCDPPVILGTLRCANKALVAINRTVIGIGMEVLTEIGRDYHYRLSTPWIYVMPYRNPLNFIKEDETHFGGLYYYNYESIYPTVLTLEVIFELENYDLPSSGYEIYNDGASIISLISYKDDTWCSTVRRLEVVFLPFTTRYYVADFNQIEIATGIQLRHGVQFHLFWTYNTNGGFSDLCIGEFPSPEVYCMETFGNDDGTLRNSTITTFSSVQSLYKLYFTGMYGGILSLEQMNYLHSNIPHIGTQPKFKTAFDESPHIIIRRAL